MTKMNEGIVAAEQRTARTAWGRGGGCSEYPLIRGLAFDVGRINTED
jgi:hypothetical protein